MPTPGPRRAFAPAGVVDELQDLEQSLSAIASHARDALGSCDGLGITVQLGGDLAFGHSNAFTTTVDAVQYGLMEGPCLEAHTTGAEVRSAQIATAEQRWPRFTPQAAEVGLRSVVSTPLLAADARIGSLNLYGATDRCFADLEPEALTLVVDTVAHELHSPVLAAQTRANARWFAGAVRERAEVERAVGVLVARYRLSRTEAQVLVQQLAQEDGVSEVVAARTVIDQDSV